MRSKVAVLRVTPDNILADIDRLVDLAGVSEALAPAVQALSDREYTRRISRVNPRIFLEECTMNYTRLALAAVVATIVDMVYGFVVYGSALASEFGRYPDVFRPMDAINAKIPFMIVGTLVAMFAIAYIYARGYEGGSGIREGLRFGALIGFFAVGYIAVGNYVVMNIGRRLAVSMAVAGFMEWAIVGMALGVVYKRAEKAPGRR